MRKKNSRGDKFEKFRELTFVNWKQRVFARRNFREFSKIEYFAASNFRELARNREYRESFFRVAFFP